MATTNETARQRLGGVIKFHREQRGRTANDAARRLKCSVARIEQIETGAVVPTAEEWKALREGINRALNTYSELRLRALAEQTTERETITRSIEVHTSNGRSNGHATKIATNLGDKLVASSTRPAPDSPTAPTISPSTVRSAPFATAAQVAAVQELRRTEPHPDPSSARAQLNAPERGTAKDGRKLAPVRPVGASSSDAVNRRRAFVRDLLTKRPDARTSGSDSVIEAVRHTFGIGISPEFVEEIREQLKREKLKAEILAELPPVAQMARVDPQLRAAQATGMTYAAAPSTLEAPNNGQPGTVNAGDLEAAVQLVLGAVPNLRTFSIAVDDSGEASIDYTVREVVVRENTGTFKVRRG